MDKETIVLMLQSIRDSGYIGPTILNTEPGRPITFILEKGLAGRSKEGNFTLTVKGARLLNGELSWEEI